MGKAASAKGVPRHDDTPPLSASSSFLASDFSGYTILYANWMAGATVERQPRGQAVFFHEEFATILYLKVLGMFMSIKELEAAVSGLQAPELAEFSRWFEEFVASRWDRQIEADILSGQLDAAGKRADQDFTSGHGTPL